MARSLARREVTARVDARLGQIIGRDLPVLGKIRKFVVKSGGKRIRPLTHYFLLRTLGGESQEWIDVGAIGELIHAASLLHDDVIDEAGTRRGRPSANALYGNKQAILSGDFVLACGLQHLSTLEHSQLLLPIFTRVIRALAVGELIQMEGENRPDLPLQKYEQIIAGKTASLFGAMTESSWILARQSSSSGATARADRLRARNFGERMGRVFQIRDDFLDYFGSDEGKDSLQDFSRGLMTQPALALRARMGALRRRQFDQLWRSAERRNSEAGRTLLLEWIRETRLQKKLAEEIESEIHALMLYLRQHPEGPERNAILEQLSRLLVQ
ncbi:MAG: polyprenyl synthetase family protein [Leptospirales bacterium]|nr:polyprenyl synthetase family protein [Leptospirales bacterium]